MINYLHTGLSTVAGYTVELAKKNPGFAIPIVISSAAHLAQKSFVWANRTHRLIYGDTTNYVSNDDWESQLKRLSSDSSQELKGALAPRDIYDVRLEVLDSLLPVVEKVGRVATTCFIASAGLTLGALSLKECADQSSAQPFDACWYNLGNFMLRPAMLPLLTIGYVASQFSLLFLPIVIPAAALNGTNKIMALGHLGHRYEWLAKSFASKEELIGVGEKIEARSKLILLSLSEHFSLTADESQKVLKPLLEAIEKAKNKKKVE